MSQVSDSLRLMLSFFRQPRAPAEATVLPNPKQAWKFLALINDLIRRSWGAGYRGDVVRADMSEWIEALA